MGREQEDPVSDRGPSAGYPRSLLDMQDADPFDFYEQRRAEGPVVFDSGMQAWLVLDFGLCRAVLTDESGFSNPYADAPPLVVQIKGGSSNITLTQGALHTRLRRFHLSLLTPKSVARYTQNAILPIINALIDQFVAAGETDLATSLANQLPTRVILALMGMPWDDDELVVHIFDLHERIMAYIGNNYALDHADNALEAATTLNELLLPYIRLRASEPSDDFISQVWHQAPDEFGEMTEDIALGICRELFLGGGDTTVHGIANALYLMLTNDHVGAAIAADRQKGITATIEEAMRLYGSVQYRYRIAANSCQLGGVEIAKGDKLVLLSAAANRDPGQFECPADIDLDRHRINDHLAFGVGPRACVGSLLARAEIFETLNAVLGRLPGLALDPHKPAPQYHGLFMRSFYPLHVKWTV